MMLLSDSVVLVVFINHGYYWEFKRPTNEKRIDDRLRSGKNQLKEALNREGKEDEFRGIVIDISDCKEPEQQLIDTIMTLVCKRCDSNTDVIIKKGDNPLKILRYKK